jgi:hypothetical protein
METTPPPASTAPEWARKFDDYGRRRWHKEKPHRNRQGEYVGTIVWNLIWLYIINHVPGWHLTFINGHYETILWALNLNVYIQIGANIVMFLFNARFVRYLMRMVIDAANFVLLIFLYYIYPFDFSAVAGWSWLDTVLPIIFIIGMVFSALSVITNFWKLLFWRG